MFNLSENCSVCISNKSVLIEITSTDVNKVKWSSKLNQCVPEVDWGDDCYICLNCIENLQVAYTFYHLCLQSYEVRKQALAVKIEEPSFDSKEIPDFVSFKEAEIHRPINKVEATAVNDDVREFIDVKNEEFCTNENKPEGVNLVELNSQEVIYTDANNRVQNYDENVVDVKTEQPPSKEEEKIRRKPKNSIKFSKKCDYCSKHFNSKQHLDTHIRTHHSKENHRTFFCSFCGKAFGTSTCLFHHTQIHLNKRGYKCSLCEKSFNTSSILRAHKICVHTDPKLWNYPCTFCDKRFPMKSGLTAHIRRHTGEKNFACHICIKRFVDKDSLINHIRTHTNERFFKCHLCDKQYKTKRALTLHLKREHDIGTTKLPKPRKKHQCCLCSKGFATRNKLQKHVRSHTGERPFSCTICKKKFNDAWYYKMHLKNKHDVESVGDNLF